MIKLRKAQLDDAEFFYNLRFSDEVIAVSLTKSKPTMEEHISWFQNKLASDSIIILIAMMDDAPLGFLRYDLNGNSAEISIALVAEARGKGLGKKILQEGESWIKKNTDIIKLTAKVLKSNPASLNMFKAQNFEENYFSLKKVLK